MEQSEQIDTSPPLNWQSKDTMTFMVTDSIRHALRATNIDGEVRSVRELSGGCIHLVRELTLSDGSRYVAKLNRAAAVSMFEEEAQSLRALAATKTVLVPQPLAVTSHGEEAVLLMTAIPTAPRPSRSAWRRLGEELASLHNAKPPHPQYGFEIDNHIGSTLQPNSWYDDWVEFNAANRLGFQLNLAMQKDLLDTEQARSIQHVITRLDTLLPRYPRSALLHGDLWSGNGLPTNGDRIALIDPACSIGDGWADIAMMQLFGGFPQDCFEAYAANVTDHDDTHRRIAVYQLYHVLNHVNIFGSGYVGQAVTIARNLLR